MKTFAIITDIHANAVSLQKALSIIADRDSVDQIICLGDCFTLGPDPEKTLELLISIDNCIFIRGNHDRYISEKLWTHEQPSLEGMDPDDPVCQEIVANNQWSAELIGDRGLKFIRKMHVAHRELIDKVLVEFTHAWYERDDQPPTMAESLNWRNHVKKHHPEIEQLVFIHGHTHIPRNESSEDLSILCQGSVGLPFDEDQRGSVAFLTVDDRFSWEVIRYDYDYQHSIDMLESRKPPFYTNLANTLKYATIRNDI